MNKPNEQVEGKIKSVVLGVTGASGSIYALKFAQILKEAEVELHLVFSETGLEVAEFELGPLGLKKITSLATRHYDAKRFWASPASGSSKFDAMVVLPCTVGTMGAIANGISNNLIHRAADCFLKERKPLILAIRETPLNEIHIKNMLTLSRAGATLFPAMPAFYTKPKDIEELSHFFAGRIARFLGIEVKGMVTWMPENPPSLD